MATIVQFTKIQSNEDILERLVSETLGGASGTVNVALRSIPNLPADRITSGTFAEGMIPSIPGERIGSGTVPNDRLGTGVASVVRREHVDYTNSVFDINSGTGRVSLNIAPSNTLTVNSSGQLGVTPVNLSSNHTFTSVAARNLGYPFDGGSQSSASIVWHRGDVAIVTANTQEATPGTQRVDGTVNIFNARDVGFNNATTALTVRNWLTNSAGPLGTGRYQVADTVTGTYGASADPADQTNSFTIPAGSTFNHNNTALIQWQDSDGNALNIWSTFPNATVMFLTGPHVPGGGTRDTGVGLGSYVYVGTDQTTAAGTDDSDWQLLRTPTASNIDGGAITSGTVADARLPASIARDTELPTVTVTGGTARPLTAITVNDAGDSIAFSTAVEDIDFSVVAGGNVVADRYQATIPNNGMQTFALAAGQGATTVLTAVTGSTTGRTTFPTAANARFIEVYIGGMLLQTSEYTFNTGRNVMTINLGTTPVDGNTTIAVILRA